MDPRDHIKEQIKESVFFISGKSSIKPRVGIVLGSGLGSLADELGEKTILPYSEIPYFPSALTMVEGHPGNLVLGKLSGENVVVMQGRFHYYEGYTMKGITFPIRVLKELGAETLIVTNVAGGINPAFEVEDIMLIKDHIDLFGTNPLIGPNDPQLGPRFPDMREAYDSNLLSLAEKAAIDEGIQVRKGIYAGVVGPTYGTNAEFEFLSKIGADTVGMSTVPEVIVAVHSGLKVLGISCIAGTPESRNFKNLHKNVLTQSKKMSEKLNKIIKAVLKKINS